MNLPIALLHRSTPWLTMLATLLSMSLVPATHAAEHDPDAPTRWYEINIAVFKQLSPGFNSEQWRDREQLALSFPPGTALLDDTSYDDVDLSEITLEPYEVGSFDTPPISPTARTHDNLDITHPTFGNDADILSFRSIRPSDEEFTQALRRLNNSKGYKIITSKSWQQPGLAPDMAIPVLIQAGEEYDGNYELEGTLTVSLSRYLHVKSNLWLSEYAKQIELTTAWWEQPSLENAIELPSDNPTSGIPTENTIDTHSPIGELRPLSIQETTTHYEAIRTVIIDESRRMRSGEMHYLDHPLFGILIKVVPIEIPDDDADAEIDEATPAASPEVNLAPVNTQ